MDRLVVAKFGGGAMGADGAAVPAAADRIARLAAGSRVVCVFSAPLVTHGGRARSVTDLVLAMGAGAAAGRGFDLGAVRAAYERIAAASGAAGGCAGAIEGMLGEAAAALGEAGRRREFAGGVRARALAFAGELLSAEVMRAVLEARGVRASCVPYSSWPIVTDGIHESANFLRAESEASSGELLRLVGLGGAVCVGGFVGRTAGGEATTYERGGSDRTAADLAILLGGRYDVRLDFAKDSAVVSADPKVVSEGLGPVRRLSYNEARLAGMFGMKILDPIAIKEILEHGADVPITITDVRGGGGSTEIERGPGAGGGHPLKIVTGKGDCAILRTEADAAPAMLASLRDERRYSEFVALSPFSRDGTEFCRLLFLDGGYVRGSERYLRGFDPLASITYGRGVVTMIGDEMWKAPQVAARAAASLAGAGINILNMDAQEETSRIILVIEDSGDAVQRAVRAVHSERAGIAAQ